MFRIVILCINYIGTQPISVQLDSTTQFKLMVQSFIDELLFTKLATQNYLERDS